MQFITDNNGKKLSVILSIATYQKMIDKLEEIKDIKSFNKAKEGPQEFIDAEEAFEEIEKSRLIKNV